MNTVSIHPIAMADVSPGRGLSAEVHATYASLNLGGIAYENHHAPVFHAWLGLPAAQRLDALRDRYVFFSVSTCVGAHLGELQRQDATKANAFAADILGAVSQLARERSGFAEEWFRGLEELVGAFTDRSDLPHAREIVAVAFQTGAVKFPRIAQTLSVHQAYLESVIGRREDAAAVALRLVRRPYLLPARRELPSLYAKLMYILAGSNHLAEYRLILWKGATSFTANAGLRETFVAQIVKTYRGALRAVLHGEVPLAYRLPFLVGNAARLAARSSWLTALRVPWLLRRMHLGALYLLDVASFGKPSISNMVMRDRSELRRPWRWHIGMPRRRPPPPKRILVTRAMGGLGDLLMMTPGLRALADKYPQAQIDFAVPKSFHAMFEGFAAVRLLDINDQEIPLARYCRWINLTDCPAGRTESRQYPNVRHNRIEIFARAMGISKQRLRAHGGLLPVYRVTADEHEGAKRQLESLNPRGLPVIGVQPQAADSYRNWPYMERLVERLAANALVLVFHHEELAGYDGPNVVKIVRPLRHSVALAAQCSRLIVVDSSFLHFSAALNVPTLAIFGAISGRLRTRDYPNVRLLAPSKDEFPCYPCWRHEYKPCHLTNGRESICFRSITVEQVLAALNEPPEGTAARASPWTRLVRWVRYGRQ
jgi:ADP-heptose:LPS heptosyltransferase